MSPPVDDEQTLARLHGDGVPLLPVKGKIPAVKSWSAFVDKRPAAADVRSWSKRRHDGWAAICGAPHGLLCLDVEVEGMADQGPAGEAIRALLGRLPETCRRTTPKGGEHAWLRVLDAEDVGVPAGVKLVHDADGVCLAETRGQGQYAVLIGPGRGELNGWLPYELERGELDEMLGSLAAMSPAPAPAAPGRSARADSTVGRDWDADPSRDTGDVLAWAVMTGALTWQDLLDPGWEPTGNAPDGRSHWKRPAYQKPTDNSVSASGQEGVGVPALTLFSTSVPWVRTAGESVSAGQALARSHGLNFGDAMRKVEDVALAGRAPTEGLCAGWPATVFDEVVRVLKGARDDDAGRLIPRELEDAVFGASSTLATVREMARVRRCSPWGVLGAVLTRVSAEVPIPYVLPPMVGTEGSLNFSAVLAGPPGTGKTAGYDVAGELLALVDQRATATGAGSGEGLIAKFLTKGAGGKLVLRDLPHCVMYADEVGLVEAIATRSGSTSESITRSAQSGAVLATTNATDDRDRYVAAGTYRLSITAGAQPRLTGALFAGSDGGTPQRYVWLPTSDPDVLDPGDDRAEPVPLGWRPPDYPGGLVDGVYTPGAPSVRIKVPAQVVYEIRSAHAARMRSMEEVDLDAHAGIARLRVAALLMFLHRGDGNPEHFTDDSTMLMWHWDLAGQVMTASDLTRRYCEVQASAARRAAQQARGHDDVARADGARAAVKPRLDSHARAIWRVVSNPGHPDSRHKDTDRGCTRRCLNRVLRHGTYEADDQEEAVRFAEAKGWIEQVEVDGQPPRVPHWSPGTEVPEDG